MPLCNGWSIEDKNVNFTYKSDDSFCRFKITDIRSHNWLALEAMVWVKTRWHFIIWCDEGKPMLLTILNGGQWWWSMLDFYSQISLSDSNVSFQYNGLKSYNTVAFDPAYKEVLATESASQISRMLFNHSSLIHTCITEVYRMIL